MGAAPGNNHVNNLDALRVFAALMVIHGHGWDLSGTVPSGLWALPFARVGLDVFFSISGYLVTSSWVRDPHLRRFLVKRALRIFPGLIACVLLTIVALGPAMTTLSVQDYFAMPQTVDYASNIILSNRLFLPGVFAGLREGGAVNGSLWSLLPEFICYLTVVLFTLVTAEYQIVALATSAIVCGSIGLVLFYSQSFSMPVSFYYVEWRYGLVEMPFFFVGAALFWSEQHFGASFWRVDLCLVFFCGNYLITAYFNWWNIPFEWFTLPYMVLSFELMSMPILRHTARFGDISYGLYLYAFPVQQTVIATWPSAQYPVLLCTILTVPIAFFSWHLVERPALHWGRKISFINYSSKISDS